MPKYPLPETPTHKQSEAVEKAAFLMIKARNEAAALLAGAGLPDDGFGFGTPCHAHIEGFGECPCPKYTGNGGPCLTRTTLDTGATPIPHSSCGHPPSKHLST